MNDSPHDGSGQQPDRRRIARAPWADADTLVGLLDDPDGHTRIGALANPNTPRSARLAALAMYGLRDAIQRRCSGWQEEGRSVSIFADELALLVGSSADVVTWLRNQGRSYGVRATFATQYPEQLPRPVRTVFMSFDSFVWFAQTNAEVVAEAAADLSLDGSDWTAADLAGLEPFTAVVRTRLGGQRLPAVPVKVAFWEGDISSYRASVLR